MDNLINIKTTWKIALLEKQIKDIDPSQDLSRQAVFERALKTAQDIKDWKEIQYSLTALKKEEYSRPFTPVSFQVRYSDEYTPILKQIQADIMEQLDLERLKANYMLQLLEKNYLDHLHDIRRKDQTKSTLLSVKAVEAGTGIDTLSILHILIEMMQSAPECAELEQISNLILNWKDNYTLIKSKEKTE